MERAAKPRVVVCAAKPRVVVCAANRYEDTIILGARHWDTSMHRIGNKLKTVLAHPSSASWEQGFIDQFGVFMTREEAWIVAEAAGQIKYRVGGDGIKLYSENLY